MKNNYDLRGCERLCNAIVAMAAKDYRKALIDEHRFPDGQKHKDAEYEVQNLEKFFRERAKYFTSLNGEELARDMKAINKCHYPTRKAYEIGMWD